MWMRADGARAVGAPGLVCSPLDRVTRPGRPQTGGTDTAGLRRPRRGRSEWGHGGWPTSCFSSGQVGRGVRGRAEVHLKERQRTGKCARYHSRKPYH
uniref:Uncharacterized protein n=1 Tax=Mustela putorius furo TaxID=9669 RepID=M3Y922_MUSPF